MKKLEKIWVDNPTNKCYNNKALDERGCKGSNLKKVKRKEAKRKQKPNENKSE